MTFAGIDIGARRTKVVRLDADVVVGSADIETGLDPSAAARRALSAAGFDPDGAGDVVATGAGGARLHLHHAAAADATCVAFAAARSDDGVTRILDVGARQSRALRIDDHGAVVAFRVSDACASGGGRFLERLPRLLDASADDLAIRAAAAPTQPPLRVPCPAVADAEVAALVAAGVPAELVMASAAAYLAARAADLLASVGGDGPVLATGGPLENPAFRRYLTAEVGASLIVPRQPSLVAALGAALLAQARATTSLSGVMPAAAAATTLSSSWPTSPLSTRSRGSAG